MPIPRAIYADLMAWKVKARSVGTAAEQLVFPGRMRAASEDSLEASKKPEAKSQQTIWSGTFLQKHVRPIATKLGITSPVTFQVLRRSFATWNRQGNLKDTQAVMGHARIETTANVYSQEVPETARELVAQYHNEIKRARVVTRRIQ